MSWQWINFAQEASGTGWQWINFAKKKTKQVQKLVVFVQAGTFMPFATSVIVLR